MPLMTTGAGRYPTVSAPSSPLSFATLFVGDPTSMVNSGGTVSQWNSLDGSGVNFSQATGGVQPGYSATDGLVFDGSNKHLENSSVAIGGTTLSVFIMLNEDATVTNFGGIVCFASGATDDYTGTGNFATSTQGGPAFIATRAGANQYSSNPTTGIMQRVGVIYDGANGTGYLNNTAGTPVAITSAFAASGQVAVGSRILSGAVSTGNCFKGYIRKVVITTVALNSTQRSELDTWLQT